MRVCVLFIPLLVSVKSMTLLFYIPLGALNISTCKEFVRKKFKSENTVMPGKRPLLFFLYKKTKDGMAVSSDPAYLQASQMGKCFEEIMTFSLLKGTPQTGVSTLL